jgi:deoxyinosine 3'endonuclease (endonuclease V)
MQKIKNLWEAEQDELKKKLITKDAFDPTKINYVAGVDISFIKDNDVDACAAYVILSYPELKVVHYDLEMVQLTQPYIPGYLAFREVEHLKKLINRTKKNKPHLTPQIIFVDGNGILHPNGLGLASHLGILVDIPTVGIGKKLFLIGTLDKNVVKKQFEERCKLGYNHLDIIVDKKIVGAAYRSNCGTTNPIYVSVGHKISLLTALDILNKLCPYRVPEPVRQADKMSREYIRDYLEKLAVKQTN